jgi:hippurate hydrolase
MPAPSAIIPDEAVLLGTIRSFKPEVRTKLWAGIERTAKAAAAMADAPAPEIRIVEGAKSIINDEAVVGPAAQALQAAFGGDKVKTSPPGTPSEDFSEFAAAGVPSMMFNIGVYDTDRWTAAIEGGTPLPGNHSPLFAPVPKPTIETGVKAMTLAVLSAFDAHARGK